MMQLNRYKATFGRHETFPLRYGWLPRGLEAREQNPASFSPPKQAMITRGVGRDRVNCIQYWLQAAGQVEIDSVCIGVRDGRNHVYRDRGQTRPVRYHRQAQSRLRRPTRPSAVRNNIPDAIPIIAVYLRVTETDQGIEFNVAECAIDDGRDDVPSLHTVGAIRHRRLRLRLRGVGG